MKQLQWIGVVCFQKYLTAFGLLNMICQTLYASPAINPSQSSVELESSSLAADTASPEFSLKIISSDGTYVEQSECDSELSRLIQSYYHLHTGPESAELKLASDFVVYDPFQPEFDRKKLFAINDSKSFCLEISKVISASIRSNNFRQVTMLFGIQGAEQVELVYQTVYLSIYSWVYRNALLRCDFEQENLNSKETVDSTSKTIEEIVEFILIINPLSSSYLDMNSRFNKGSFLSQLCYSVSNETKMLIFTADPLIIQMQPESSLNRKFCRAKKYKNDKTIEKVKDDHLALYRQLNLFFENSKNQMPYSEHLKMSLENLGKLLERFEESLTKAESTPKDKVSDGNASVIEFCRSKLVLHKSHYSMLETTVQKYVKLFEKLDKVFKSIFDWSIKKALQTTHEKMKNLSWIRELMLFQPYCLETANIIESKPKMANAVADSVIEVLEQEDSIYFDKFIRKYNVFFPGLLKSICDRKPLSSDEKAKLLSIRHIILKIRHEECGIQDLMSLYYAVQNAEVENDQIQMLIRNLLGKLFNEGIKEYDDIGKSTEAFIPMLVYALNILVLRISTVPSCPLNVFEICKEVIIYTVNLQQHISEALGGFSNPPTQTISEVITLIRNF